MKTFKTLAAAACLTVASVGLVSADTWNKKTILTVNEPIQVPGKMLEPGKYVMKLMDSPSNRHIVQIFNESESQLQTTILAIPNYRLQPTGKTEFQWWEVPAGQPKALRAWFYPGDNFGQEFAYPKNMAVQIASVNESSVPTTYAEKEAELATARVGTVDKAGTEQELDRQTYNAPAESAATPAPATPAPQTEVAQVRTPEAAPATPAPVTEQPAMQPERARTELPETGSSMPLVGLSGLLAMGAGFALRAAARRF